MARAGAKRKPRIHLARKAPIVDYRALAAEQPHRRVLPKEHRLAPEAGTMLGYLYLLGSLTEQQHEAGKRYATIVDAYLKSINGPVDGLSDGRGYPCSGNAQCGLVLTARPCECLLRKQKYNLAFAALSEAGTRATSEVTHVAVYGRDCKNIHYLRCGLDVLARYLLTNKRKSAIS